jgi:hypothetical protein
MVHAMLVIAADLVCCGLLGRLKNRTGTSNVPNVEVAPCTFREECPGTHVVASSVSSRRGISMICRLLIAFIVLCCVSFASGQEIPIDDIPRPEFRGLTQKQLSRLVFSNEQAMITSLSSLHLVTEAYVQSLGHHQSKGMDRTLDERSDAVIDDVYFLSRADFSRDPPVEGLLAGGGPWRNRYIETNAGALEQIHPNGMVSMLFVDFNSFDADTYSLMYAGEQSLANTACLVFTVVPVKERSGRFHGQIWVDSSSFGIVRIKGVFIGPYKRWNKMLTGPDRYFHFDSWREKINNRWVPSSMYFDERHLFHTDGNLEFHYRGYAFLWQQQDEPTSAAQSVGSSTENILVQDGSLPQNSLITRLETDGLLASPGPQEERLDRIVREILPISGRGVPNIHCRILLTTPAELFAAGNAILVSRGLLNIVPDDSILAYMLARQVAHILLGHTGSTVQPLSKSLFDLGGKKDFGGFGIGWKPDEEATADAKASLLLKGTPYESAVPRASAFVSQLKAESHRFPNLVRARFGVGIMPEGSSLTNRQVGKIQYGEELRFENRYGVSWNRVIIDSEEQRAQFESRAPDTAVSVHTSPFEVSGRTSSDKTPR